MPDSRPVDDLFLEAIRLPPTERDAFVASCTEDDDVRARLATLLSAHREAPDFLETAAVPAPDLDSTTHLPSQESAGAIIGRYKLLQQIGEGGFGSVWMAEQKEPVKRRVALKIIKLGMDTKQVIARFEAERQALAMMDHPNIARVFDAGATATGRPYFVMEYVRGVGIVEYCDTEKLDTRARLELFVKVCNAIQHAHQKGLIHRDIKPSNVMVTLHDGVPVPKVIDFGVAKATNTELTQKTLFTEHRQMIGTPAYMSPEQAEMTGLDIDTRSDIYSLGVLLYELLTGTTPFDTNELTSRGYAEMMRIIREQEPHKPSTRLSTLGDSATLTADRRRVDRRRLGHMLRGDLDWIVMRCLEKDRTRRYETANGLAADLRRHLRDEPVAAGPPSGVYRLRKFLHRNRTGVLAGVLVVLFLVIGLSLAIAGMREAQEGRREAMRLADLERLARERAEVEREKARQLASVIGGDVSIAILPLANATGDPEQAYFAAGMTNSLIEGLHRIDERLDVKPFDSVVRFADLGLSDREIARELGADLLISGAVSRQADRVTISISLDHPALGLNLWERTYEADSSELFRLQQQVSADTLREVPLARTVEDLEDVRRRDTINPRAREAYYKGMHKLHAANTEDIERAIVFFDDAIALDAKYALAYLGKAQAYLAQSTMGVLPDLYNVPARKAALRAIELDETLAGAHAVLGEVQLAYDWDWAAAKTSFDRALELDPYLPHAHAGMSMYHVTVGEFDKSIEHLRKAIQIDPGALLLHESIMYTPFFSRRLDVAIEICQDALDLDAGYWSAHAWMGQALAYSGDFDNAIIHLEEAWRIDDSSPIALTLLASTYAMKARRDDDPALLEKAREYRDQLFEWYEAEYICPYEIATVLLALGDPKGAIEWIEMAEEARSECMPFMGVDLRMDEIRGDPEFQAIMERIGHPLHGKPGPWLKDARPVG